MSTPPPPHPPPSLPTSPLAKRPKPSSPKDMATNGSSEAPVLAPPHSSAASPPLLVKKLSPQARTPTRGSAFAAGYDLYSAKGFVVPKRGKGLVDTGLAIAVGVGCCGFILFILPVGSVSEIYHRWPNSPPLRPRSQAFYRHRRRSHRFRLQRRSQSSIVQSFRSGF